MTPPPDPLPRRKRELERALRRTASTTVMLALFAFPCLTQAQPKTAQSLTPPRPTVESGVDIPVSSADRAVHIEPHLAVHPEDPDRLVAAAMVLSEPGEGFTIVVYRSADGGATWRSAPLFAQETSAPSEGVDPWLAYGPEGALYLSKLPDEVWHSIDDGATWSGPSRLPDGAAGGFDATRIAVDASGGARNGWLYAVSLQNSVPRAGGGAAAGVAVLRSSDQGLSFLGPEHLALSDVGVRHGDLRILRDGTLLVVIHDLFHEGEPVASPRLWSLRSTDGGSTFTAPSLVTDRFLAISPLLAEDRSDGPHRGRAYAAWMGLGGDRNRYVAHTDDAGDTWSDPLPLTTLPDSTRHPTYTAVAVSDDGTVGVMWAENVIEAGANCYAYRFAASTDGGTSFTSPVTVSDRIACSDTDAHRVIMHDDGPRQATVLQRFPQGGDYFGFVALPRGVFQAVWPDARTGVFQLWTDRIEVR